MRSGERDPGPPPPEDAGGGVGDGGVLSGRGDEDEIEVRRQRILDAP
jgi:hypothetical protein